MYSQIMTVPGYVVAIYVFLVYYLTSTLLKPKMAASWHTSVKVSCINVQKYMFKRSKKRVHYLGNSL